MKTPGISLLDALKQRRSRRFCLGMSLKNGPLAFESKHKPVPLSANEEALIAFAAAGVTGPALADLEYNNQSGGNIMAGLIGRTIASGDGLQTVALALINDSGAWLYRRPQELPVTTVRELIELSNRDEFLKISELSRVQIANSRVHPSKEPLFNVNVNRWSVYAPGTSYFLPINDLTFMYINGLLEILNEDTGVYLLDERAGFRPAGLKSFGKSRGGHLYDDINDGRVGTIVLLERLVTEFVTSEQGMMLQNAALMTHALGLGGFPNFANHDFGWFDALGFEMEQMPVSDYLGIKGIPRLAMKFLGKTAKVPLPYALKRNGETLLKAYCPPNFASMRAAVEAVVQHKFGQKGVFRSPSAIHPWKEAVSEKIEKLSDPAIEATIAYCEYVWQNYGRFPAYMPPFRTILGFQAGHLDLEFYNKYYPAGAVTQLQRDDFAKTTGG